MGSFRQFVAEQFEACEFLDRFAVMHFGVVSISEVSLPSLEFSSHIFLLDLLRGHFEWRQADRSGVFWERAHKRRPPGRRNTTGRCKA